MSSGSEIEQRFDELRRQITSLPPSLPEEETLLLRGIERLYQEWYRDLLVATSPTSPPGPYSPNDWDRLSQARRVELENRLGNLEKAVASITGPADKWNLMFRTHAGNVWMAFLLVLSFVGTAAVLYKIAESWSQATGDSSCADAGVADAGIADGGEGALASATGAKAEGREPTGEVRDAGAAKSEAPSRPNVDRGPVGGLAGQRSPDARSSSPAPGQATAGNQQGRENTCRYPRESDVLWMVILMGALGGFIHLGSSLVMFIGNRRLMRSWTPYYLFLPIEGAALAPIIYLMLRVGVLAPARSGEVNLQALNFWGIYGFAALTGLFSKQAVETLHDVFVAIFKKVEAKDSINKSKN